MTGGHSVEHLARSIDHTVLAPDAPVQTIRRFCAEAIEHGFHSVCVNSRHASLVAELLAGSTSRTCVVVGFPFGACSTAAKRAETAQAIADGAHEIDIVIAIGALKDVDLDHVRRDIAAVRSACASAVLKVIIETCLLGEAEKRTACAIARAEHADFVKTSTGFSTAGATLEDVHLLVTEAGPSMRVKASGGIRTRVQAEAMLAAGAARIGTSSGVQILSGGHAPSEY